MPDTESTRKQLDLIRLVAIVDVVLLIVLVACAVSDAEGAVSILGPIHGIGFLLLVFLCLRGAGEKRWGWWFPVVVVVTAGPIGSLLGEMKIRRDLPARA